MDLVPETDERAAKARRSDMGALAAPVRRHQSRIFNVA